MTRDRYIWFATKLAAIFVLIYLHEVPAWSTDAPGRGFSVAETTQSTVDRWSNCSRESQPAPLTLCAADASQVDTRAFGRVQEALRDGATDFDELCKFDELIVNTGEMCAARGRPANDTMMSTLMRLVADNWVRIGDLDRAEVLYIEVLNILDEYPYSTVDKQYTLQDLSYLNILSDEGGLAKKFAEQSTLRESP